MKPSRVAAILVAGWLCGALPWGPVQAQQRTAGSTISEAPSSDPGALAKQIRLARRRGEADAMLEKLEGLDRQLLLDQRVHGERLQALLDTGRSDEAEQLARIHSRGSGGQAIPFVVALARLAFRRGDLELAEKQLVRVRKVKPQQLDLKVLELRIALRRGDGRSAQVQLDALKASLNEQLATELEVDLAVSRAGELMSADDLLDRALALLEHAVELAPQRVDARSLYVRALARWQRVELGEAVAQEGLKSAEGVARADLLHALGFLYLGAHREEEARGLFEEALELSPHHALARVGLARARWKGGDRDGARQQISQILAANPEDLDALLLLADIDSAAGDWDQAGEVLETLLKVKPRHLKALWVLSRVRARQHRPEEVQALVERYEQRRAVLAERR